jgi:hypothetical protein
MVSFFVPPELLFSLTQRCWLSDGMWVTEEEGGGLPPLLDFGHLIRFHGFPSSYGALWCPDDFLLKNKFSILFCLGVKMNGIRAGRRSLGPSPNTRWLMQLSRYQMPGVLEDARQKALHPRHGAILSLTWALHHAWLFLNFLWILMTSGQCYECRLFSMSFFSLFLKCINQSLQAALIMQYKNKQMGHYHTLYSLY